MIYGIGQRTCFLLNVCIFLAFSLEFQEFFSITKIFFLKVGQNNFVNRITETKYVIKFKLLTLSTPSITFTSNRYWTIAVSTLWLGLYNQNQSQSKKDETFKRKYVLCPTPSIKKNSNWLYSIIYRIWCYIGKCYNSFWSMGLDREHVFF